MKAADNQYDLFVDNLNLLCVRGVEDNSHFDKLSSLISSANSLFVLECGDYKKSKLITNHFIKSRDAYAVASFENDATLASLCKLLLPANTSDLICHEVAKIINNTDEWLISLFRKISLLIENREP